MNYWVFMNGGLFDGQFVEDPPFRHIVNLPGQNQALNGGTLCGWARFTKESAGGAGRPSACAKGNVIDGQEEGPVCPLCADALVWVSTKLLEDDFSWDAFKLRMHEKKRKALAY